MVGSVVALLHPGIDVAAALDLPFVDVWDMAERFELLGDPERPVAVDGSIADENIGHRACANSLDRGQGIMGAGRAARNHYERTTFVECRLNVKGFRMPAQRGPRPTGHVL